MLQVGRWRDEGLFAFVEFGEFRPYNAWNVEFSLWARADRHAPSLEVKSSVSQVDLRKILPTGTAPFVVSDVFELGPDISRGTYELRVAVVDPKAYMKPMQLAHQPQDKDGAYPLGRIVIHDK